MSRRTRAFEERVRAQLRELEDKVNADQPFGGVDVEDGTLTNVHNVYGEGDWYYRFRVNVETRGERNALRRVLEEMSTSYGISGGQDWWGRGAVRGHLYVRSRG